MDLTPYAGKNILLRFEYVTDDAVNKQGFSIDDIRIPEIGFQDDAESDAGGWEPRGFVRSDNAVPQRYIVQIVELGGQSQVRRFDFPPAPAPAAERAAPPQVESGPAQPIIVRGLGRDVNRVVIVISALAPITNQVAPYHIALERSGAEHSVAEAFGQAHSSQTKGGEPGQALPFTRCLPGCTTGCHAGQPTHYSLSCMPPTRAP